MSKFDFTIIRNSSTKTRDQFPVTVFVKSEDVGLIGDLKNFDMYAQIVNGERAMFKSERDGVIELKFDNVVSFQHFMMGINEKGGSFLKETFSYTTEFEKASSELAKAR